MSDIQETESNLGTYTVQLSAVNSALTTAPDDSELTTLRDDLVELISITEGTLLNLKKNQLLSDIAKEETAEEAGSGEEEEDGDLNSFVGMKCSVEYTSSWGTVQQQNCVVLSVDVPEDEGETTLRLLFLTPSSKSMLPCKQFMNSSCKFENCKFSHGYEVPMTEIRGYQEPNFDNFHKGKRCLCKTEEELWVPGTVTSVTKDQVYVKPDGSGVAQTFTYDNVFPLQSSGESSDSDLELEDIDSVELQESLPTSSSQNLNFGGWEEHTNSFGSRMLFKMGYVSGKGLGPRGQGILDPIEADVIPKGVSLDSIKHLRERRLIRTVSRLNVILKQRAARQAGQAQEKVHKSVSMFTMMDNVFKARGTKRKCPPKNKKPINKVSEKTVRVKSVTIENDIIRCKQRLLDLRKSLNRNRNDRNHCSRVQSQIDGENKQLDSLMSKQKSVESELKFRTEKKKLKIF